jgi:hypothetical protein
MQRRDLFIGLEGEVSEDKPTGAWMPGGTDGIATLLIEGATTAVIRDWTDMKTGACHLEGDLGAIGREARGAHVPVDTHGPDPSRRAVQIGLVVEMPGAILEGREHNTGRGWCADDRQKEPESAEDKGIGQR